MNSVVDKQRGLIPTGLKGWPLQPIEHLTNATSVAPPPAGPADCRPLYLLHLLKMSFPVKYFTDRSKAVLLFRVFYVFVLSCVCYVFVRVCLYVLCGHLLGKG